MAQLLTAIPGVLSVSGPISNKQNHHNEKPLHTIKYFNTILHLPTSFINEDQEEMSVKKHEETLGLTNVICKNVIICSK
jgi:hypothetical protein